MTTGPTERRRLKVVPAAPEPLTAERLFREQLLPLYPPGASLDAVRSTDANPANNPAILEAIGETAKVFAALAPEALERTDLSLDESDASVHRLSAALTVEARDAMFARRAKPGEPPVLVHFIIHASLYVGACAVKNHSGRWLVRNPLWETRVLLESKAGRWEIAPFSWVLRALSDEHMGKVTLADRYRTHLEVPFEDVDRWPIIAPVDRRIPRLARVRYDLLYQHLKRHVPELDEFGADFPPPDRFAELGFRWLDFLLVGGGRALLIHGPAERGTHLLWLTKAGFIKSAFYSTDSYAIERGQTTDGTETLLLSLLLPSATEHREMLWWGP